MATSIKNDKEARLARGVVRTGILAFIAESAGYIVLLLSDWHIAAGIFLVHFSINLNRKLDILNGVDRIRDSYLRKL